MLRMWDERVWIVVAAGLSASSGTYVTAALHQRRQKVKNTRCGPSVHGAPPLFS